MSIRCAARRFYQQTVLFLCLFFSSLSSGQDPTFDIVISGGRLVDGSGNPWVYADVGISQGRIAAIGKLDNESAGRVIDATGMVVSPGFIDLHGHTNPLGNPLLQSKIRQGVTVDVMGEGGSVAPRDGLDDAAEGWTDFTGYFDLVEKQGIALNIISHVSEGQLRRVVMGYDPRPATPGEMNQMKSLMDRSLKEGAWGLVSAFESGGPEHPDEVVELAKVASKHGSVYVSHIGSEGYEQEKELNFAFRLAEEADIPVHILHLKIRGRELWDEMPDQVAMIEAARSRGLDITANQYPYTAMQHGWNACFPVWMRENGPEQFTSYLRDESLRDRIKSDPEFIAFSQEHGWWEGIVMTVAELPEFKQYEGKAVAEIASLREQRDPADTMIDLMAAQEGRVRGVFHNQSEDNVQMILRKPWVAVASDGTALDLDAPGFPHPRSYGTNPRVLGYYARELGVLSLEDAVRKMTSLPAQIMGIRDRGLIAPGYAADVVIFDPDTVRDTNSFEAPKSYPTGIPYVLVNGVAVVDNGEHTGALPGKVLYGPGYAGDNM